jgi:7,8-dihydropterin-6-yl-methyl-4-(beta-D-ribofuranosyl)aminobenzene 5'-phosphate synthase
VTASDADIEKVVTSLHDTWDVDYVAPGHCTGEPTFNGLKRVFGERYLYAGLGSQIEMTQAR